MPRRNRRQAPKGVDLVKTQQQLDADKKKFVAAWDQHSQTTMPEARMYIDNVMREED